MSVSIAPGACQICGRYGIESTDTVLTLSGVSATSGRIDLIVLRLDLEARDITIKVIPGTPAQTPEAPYSSLQRAEDGSQYDLLIAKVTIPNNTATITNNMIDTSVRLGEYCGVVAVPLKSFDLSDLYAAYEESYRTWLASVQALLDGNDTTKLTNAVANLQNIVGVDSEHPDGTIASRFNTVQQSLETVGDTADGAIKAYLLWENESPNRIWNYYPDLVPASNTALEKHSSDSVKASDYDAIIVDFKYFGGVSYTKKTGKSAPTVNTIEGAEDIVRVLVSKGTKARAIGVFPNALIATREVSFNTDGTVQFYQAFFNGQNGNGTLKLTKTAAVYYQDPDTGADVKKSYTKETYHFSTRTAKGYYENAATSTKNEVNKSKVQLYASRACQVNRWMIPQRIYGVKNFPSQA